MKATKLQVFTDSQFAGEIIRQIVHSFGEIDLRLTYDGENSNRVLIRRNFEDSAEAHTWIELLRNIAKGFEGKTQCEEHTQPNMGWHTFHFAMRADDHKKPFVIILDSTPATSDERDRFVIDIMRKQGCFKSEEDTVRSVYGILDADRMFYIYHCWTYRKIAAYVVDVWGLWQYSAGKRVGAHKVQRGLLEVMGLSVDLLNE